MIRAFVGVRIDPDVSRKISEAQTQIAQRLSGIRWVATQNLHFTLKFLGSIEEEKVAPIANELQDVVRPFPRFSILARGIGVFPDIKRARVLWVGLEGESLVTLANKVEEMLEGFGFDREKRDFKPHLTIGRWRQFNKRPEILRDQIEKWRGYDFGRSWVEEVVLFQSTVRPEGAVYSALESFPLSRRD